MLIRAGIPSRQILTPLGRASTGSQRSDAANGVVPERPWQGAPLPVTSVRWLWLCVHYERLNPAVMPRLQDPTGVGRQALSASPAG